MRIICLHNGYYKRVVGYNQNVRLRSANRNNANNTWNVNNSGNVNNNNAYNTNRCAPDCVTSSRTHV